MTAESPERSFIHAATEIVGTRYVLTDPADMAPYLTEWRGYYSGRSPAVVRPGSTAEISALLRLANETKTPIVPQGGNTGLVGGQTPDSSGREVVIAMQRLDRIRAVDAAGGTLATEAGVTLQRIQDAADEAGMLFPLSLGSQGSCQIGGNISTNAGGTGVVAFGNTRSLVLGLEVVLPNGDIWDGMRALRKDNTGYDLKQLFIGAEGTLGIVTAAVLRLFPKPRGMAVAIAGMDSPASALALFRLARERAGQGLTGFELMGRTNIVFGVRHLPGARDPLGEPHSWYALVEISSGEGEEDAMSKMEGILADALAAGAVEDATIASSLAQAAAFWHMRHGQSEAQKPEGVGVRHDVSVAVDRTPEFIERVTASVTALVPGIRPVGYGHLGDGNIHLNFVQPVDMTGEAFEARTADIHAAVYEVVADMGGSVAAEHGIGRYKQKLLEEVKSPLELALMRSIKATLDPNNILNPGRVIALR